MQKPSDWDSTQAKTGEGYETLPLGGHVCIIKDARIESGDYGDKLIIAFDIAPGEKYQGYYEKQFKALSEKYPDTKWKGTYRQNTEGTGVPFFKGMIEAIQKSNPGYTWNWDEKTLKGKKFGGVFGREAFEARDGSTKYAVKCFQIRSVEAIRAGVEIPKDKPLRGSKSSSAPSGGFTELQDSVLPF